MIVSLQGAIVARRKLCVLVSSAVIPGTFLRSQDRPLGSCMKPLPQCVAQRLNRGRISEHKVILKWMWTGLTDEVSSSRVHSSAGLKDYGSALRPINSEIPRKGLCAAGDVSRDGEVVQRSTTPRKGHGAVCQGIAYSAGVNFVKVPSRQVSVLVVVTYPLHGPILKLKYLISIGRGAADHATAS